MAKFIMKLTFRALAPCHLLRRRAIRRARNTSSWSFHDGTVWLFLTSLILKFSVSLLHLRGNNLWFVFSFMVRRLIEICESLGQCQKSVSFVFLFFTWLVSRRDKSWKKIAMLYALKCRFYKAHVYGFMNIAWKVRKSGAHQMEPLSPLISWVNPFPSGFINRTIFFCFALESHECACCLLSFLYFHWLFPLSACETSSGNSSIYKSIRERVTPRACVGDRGSIWWAPGKSNLLFYARHPVIFMVCSLNSDMFLPDKQWILFYCFFFLS